MKRATVLLLAGILALSLAACGNKPSDNKAPEGNQNESQEGNQKEPEDDKDQTNEPDNDTSLSGDTVGQTLLNDFKAKVEANKEATAQELADGLLENPCFAESSMATMPVQPGLLNGFNNAEITGFKEGVMFSPMIGTIPFVGYVFVLEDGADVDAFMKTLKDNGDLRWNICTEAEEMVVDHVENRVFFVMSPKSFEVE